MKPSSLVVNVGEKISFSTNIIGTFIQTPIIQIANFGDGITQQKA
jgi:hypothetical protein